MKASHVWQTTRACFVNRIAGIMLFIYLMMLVIAFIILWSTSPAKLAEIVTMLAGIPAVFWWAFVSSRSLKILRDADRLLLPAPLKAIGTSLVFQAIITIVIPAIVCTVLGGHFLETLITLFAFAAGGLLFMLLPRYLGVAMSFLPSLLNSLGKHGVIPAANTDEYLPFISVLVIAMVLLAAGLFHRLRFFDGDFNTWQSPMALLPDAANGWNAYGWTKSEDGKALNLGMNFEAAVAPANATASTTALRTYLGGPFTPLTPRGKVRQLLILALTYVAVPGFMIFSTTSQSNADRSLYAALAVCWVSFIGLGFTFSSMLMRLQNLYTKDNTELAELALLPGWKNPPNAKNLLLKVMAQHIGRTLLLPISLAVLAAALIGSKSTVAFYTLAFILLTSSLMAAGFGLNIISGRKRHAWLLGAVCLVMFVFSMIQLLQSVRSREFIPHSDSLLVWTVLVAIAAIYLLFSWRPFKNQQHPFLRN